MRSAGLYEIWTDLSKRRDNMRRAVLIAFVMLAIAEGKNFSQATLSQGRSLPVFEVDRTWPKVPTQWKLGDPSSIAIDARDNVWVLHRPRTLKPEQLALAAPPVIV